MGYYYFYHNLIKLWQIFNVLFRKEATCTKDCAAIVSHIYHCKNKKPILTIFTWPQSTEAVNVLFTKSWKHWTQQMKTKTSLDNWVVVNLTLTLISLSKRCGFLKELLVNLKLPQVYFQISKLTFLNLRVFISIRFAWILRSAQAFIFYLKKKKLINY